MPPRRSLVPSGGHSRVTGLHRQRPLAGRLAVVAPAGRPPSRRPQDLAGPSRSGPETGWTPLVLPDPSAVNLPPETVRFVNRTHFVAGIIINFGINNARPLYLFYEQLYLPFNELHLTNRKGTRLSWWDEAAGEGPRAGAGGLSGHS